MAKQRFHQHKLAGKEFSAEENIALAQKAKQILDNEYQGYREVTILPDDRVYINTKTSPMEENESQKILSLLIGAKAEEEALLGRKLGPQLNLSDTDKKNIEILYEVIGRGLLHPDSLQIAGRGFRHPSQVSTDDLVDKLITETFQRGRGYDPETGGAFNMQYTQSGHKEDDNIKPELGHDINNIAQQARINNLVTADSAKNRSGINPKYKSIIDQRNKALDLIREQYNSGYVDTKYNIDGDLDVYGSALDDLLDTIKSEEIYDHRIVPTEARKMSPEEIKAQEYKDEYMDAVRTSIDEEGEGDNRSKAMIFKNKGDVIIEGSPRLNGNGKNGH